MTYYPETHHRHSIRLQHYDYSQSGAYFVTLCTHNKNNLFGEIKDDRVMLNEFSKIVNKEWQKSEEIRKEIILDEFIVMPNHFHGIVFLDNPNDPSNIDNVVRANCRSPLRMKPKSIPSLIAGFKSTVTKQINILRNTPQQPVWQRNYYEHVIRDEHDLNDIRHYIKYNALKWQDDKYYNPG